MICVKSYEKVPVLIFSVFVFSSVFGILNTAFGSVSITDSEQTITKIVVGNSTLNFYVFKVRSGCGSDQSVDVFIFGQYLLYLLRQEIGCRLVR